jgi:hypothetical protein
MKSCLLLTLCLASACSASPQYEPIPATSFHNYGAEPLRHTLYLGSDKQFHYFVWENGKAGGHWKVNKSEMPFAHEWLVGNGEVPLTKDSEGHWQPYSQH